MVRVAVRLSGSGRWRRRRHAQHSTAQHSRAEHTACDITALRIWAEATSSAAPLNLSLGVSLSCLTVVATAHGPTARFDRPTNSRAHENIRTQGASRPVPKLLKWKLITSVPSKWGRRVLGPGRSGVYSPLAVSGREWE